MKNSKRKPLILITNDDGFTAPGIMALVEAVSEFGELLIVAPDSPQSGMGHAITINNPLRVQSTYYFNQHKAYSCSGTPVDCVKLGIYLLAKESRKPDLVLSGVNHGSNVSTNVLYSGTMSAAIEGAMSGIPSIGFSLLDFDLEADFTVAQHFVKKIVKQALTTKMEEGICLNVNVPKLPLSEIKGIKVAKQAKAFWDDAFDEREDPLNKSYYWLAGQFQNHDSSDDTDMWALKNNYISVVPTQYDLTAYDSLKTIAKQFEIEL